MDKTIRNPPDPGVVMHRNERRIHFIAATSFNLIGIDQRGRKFRFVSMAVPGPADADTCRIVEPVGRPRDRRGKKDRFHDGDIARFERHCSIAEILTGRVA